MESTERQTTPVPNVDFISFDSPDLQTPPQSEA